MCYVKFCAACKGARSELREVLRVACKGARSELREVLRVACKGARSVLREVLRSMQGSEKCAT